MRTKVVVVAMVLLPLAGCGSDFLTGMGIGAGTSEVVSEGQRLAQEHKSALIATILDLQAQLEQATDPTEVADLQGKLAKLEKQRDIAEITSTVADTLNEGLQRDWQSSDPNILADNVHWAVLALGGLFGWEKTRSNKKNTRIEALAREVGANSKTDAGTNT